MSLSVAGKTALITGGGSGINLAFASLLLSKGCSVVIGDVSLRPEAQSLLAKYRHPSASSPSALFHKTDVTSWPQLSSLWKTALSSFPSVDIVVPGAGLFEPDWSAFWNAPRTETNPDSVSRDDANGEPGHYATIDVNLTAPIRLTQLAVGHWTQTRRQGTLVHVSSIAGYSAAVNTPLYFASKHGLIGFVRSLADLRDNCGIRVSCVCPGTIRTPMWSEDPSKAPLMKGFDDWIEPEEVAEGMYQLAVDERYGDGTILEVTRGATRVIPLYHSEPPSGKGSTMKGFFDLRRSILEGIKRGVKI